jgi:hypothetical protein
MGKTGDHVWKRKFPILMLFIMLAVLLLVVAFPRRRPLRDIVAPITYFDRFFKRNAFYLSRSLTRLGTKCSLLYRSFCTDPHDAGQRLERILDAAWRENAYCAPLMKVFLQENGIDCLDGARSPDIARAVLSVPPLITYGGDRALEIQSQALRNWSALPGNLQQLLCDLLDVSSRSAGEFRKLRTSLEVPVLNRDGRPAPVSLALKSAMEQAGDADMTDAWRSLAGYTECIDRFLREATDLYAPYSSVPIPGDDWFPEGILYAAQTPFGLVLVGGPSDNIYPAGDIFLLIDLGGNDTYFFDEMFMPRSKGGKPSYCSTILDCGGNDFYTGEAGMVAAGVLGYRTIVDTEGDDRYACRQMGLAAGIMGAGILIDADGSDHYTAEDFSLGAGAFGIGILMDGGGDDRYKGARMCQGFSGPSGMGCLVEDAGDDLYACSVPETEGLCFAQGCFAGFHSGNLGGMALLLDLAGDDIYRCGSTGQGTAVGPGFGMILDAQGYDFYSGLDRCQGVGIKGGIGLIRDLKGNDHYLARDLSQGMGDEDSLGLLMDDQGDDRYSASKVSQGKNQANGTGMLYDREGKDRFSSQ